MERVLYSVVNGYYAPKRYTLTQALKQMLYWAIAQGESARHFKIETLDHRVIVEVDDELGEYIAPEYEALVKAYARYWLSEHRAEMESHLRLLRAADELERRRAEMKKAVRMNLRMTGETAWAQYAFGRYLEALLKDYDADEGWHWTGGNGRGDFSARATAESYAKIRKYAEANGIYCEGSVDGEAVEFGQIGGGIKGADKLATVEALEAARSEEAKIRFGCGTETLAAVRAKIAALEADLGNFENAAEPTVTEAPEPIEEPESKETVEGTILAPDREAAEAAMFFLVDVLGEDEFVGLDDNTVYFGTNITAATYAKIREYVEANGLKAEFAA